MRICIVLMLALFSTLSFGSDQLYINTALFYAQENAKYDDTKLDNTKTYYHVGLGLQLASGLMVGGKYVVLEESSKNNDGDKSATTLSGFGASVGYLHGSGFGLMGTYLFEPEKVTKSGGSTTATWQGGSGSVIDVGYYFDQGDWAIGPQLSIVSATYKEIEANDEEIELDSDYEETYMYPYVSLFFFF